MRTDFHPGVSYRQPEREARPKEEWNRYLQRGPGVCLKESSIATRKFMKGHKREIVADTMSMRPVASCLQGALVSFDVVSFDVCYRPLANFSRIEGVAVVCGSSRYLARTWCLFSQTLHMSYFEPHCDHEAVSVYPASFQSWLGS